MQKWQIWLQAFLAALTAFLQAGLPVHTAAQQARSAADEAITHIHPDVFRGRDTTGTVLTQSPENPIPEPNPPDEEINGQVAQLGSSLQGDADGQGEDDMERARR